jgi:hypothetical protein
VSSSTTAELPDAARSALQAEAEKEETAEKKAVVPGRGRRGWRTTLIVCLCIAGLGYTPVLLWLGASTGVVVVTGTPVIGLAVEVLRRIFTGDRSDSTNPPTGSA